MKKFNFTSFYYPKHDPAKHEFIVELLRILSKLMYGELSGESLITLMRAFALFSPWLWLFPDNAFLVLTFSINLTLHQLISTLLQKSIEGEKLTALIRFFFIRCQRERLLI